jgi:hypothetical protein
LSSYGCLGQDRQRKRGFFSGMLRGVSNSREGSEILTFLFRPRLVSSPHLQSRSSWKVDSANSTLTEVSEVRHSPCSTPVSVPASHWRCRVLVGLPQNTPPMAAAVAASVFRAPALGIRGSMPAPPSPATTSLSASPAPASGPPPATRRGHPQAPLS